ncbi:MAG: NADH-quinone oxidoreductase subunit N [Anaerolineales bacterium]|nr:NADH-quinone oxidoreductase subunit N [Anaerolineales bacterium]
MTPVAFSPAHLLAVLPEILLVVVAAIVIIADLAQRQITKGQVGLAMLEARRRNVGLAAALGFLVVLVVSLLVSLPSVGNDLIFGGMLRHDLMAFIFRVLFLFSGMVVALISMDSPTIGKQGEYYVVLVAAVLGMNLMAASADLIMLYLAVETTSIALYALAGFLREDSKSAESGLKYFLFGAFTSTIMLYGFSLLYGFTGQTNLYAIGEALTATNTPVLFALFMILVGLGFKISAVPFHFWAPDVYEGAPTPITAFLSVASKAAGFAVLIRVLMAAFPAQSEVWVQVIAALSAVTMTVGNIIALTQKNIKRLLAYSSIAQAGYILMGLAAFSGEGTAATLFYLGMYTLTNLAAFGAIVMVTRISGSESIADFSGLSRRAPGLALVMLVAFLSLGGIPPLAGFFGKFYLFTAALNQGLVWLAVVGFINALISLYYYLVVLKVIYLNAPKDEASYPVSRPAAVALWLCVMGVFVVGVLIGPWVNIAVAAANGLF